MTDFSYQLYCSRNFPPMENTLKMVKDAGYTYVEGYGAMFADADSLTKTAELVSAAGLSMPTAHIGLETLENQPQLALDAVDRLGIEVVFVPHIGPPDRPTDADGWRAFAKRVEAACAPLRAKGITCGWHNHDFEFVRNEDGSYPIELLIGNAPSLKLELDLAWIKCAGEDPVAWVEKLADHIVAVHIKDIAPEGECADEDGWADVGQGTMPWDEIKQAVAKTQCRFLVVEHDNPSDDQRFATSSIKFTKSHWS